MRRGFTLTELLVAITIIAILVSIGIWTMGSAAESGREARTRATIMKLHSFVLEQYGSYTTRRLPLILPPNTSPRDAALLRLYAMRDLIRMEMPERRTDILGGPATAIPQPRFHVAYQAWLTRMEMNEGFGDYTYIEAEIFYRMVQTVAPDSRELFMQSEIGDLDGDGAMEFLDGWGRPIYFLRWAPAFYDSNIQGRWAMADHDPLDVRRLDSKAFRTVPLIYSSGPDGVYGVDVAPGVDYSTNPAVDPYQATVGALIEDGGHHDNIHNHRLAP